MAKINIDRTLYDTKPTDNNRLNKEMITYEILDKLNIDYTRIDHDAVATIDDCHEIENVLETDICKNLFLRNSSKTNFYLLLIPGSKKFITKNISKQIGSSRLSFAEGEYMEEYLNITPGSVSILGLIYDKNHKVNLLIDKEVIESEYIGCHPCINTSSLRIKTSDIVTKFLEFTGHKPTIVEL